MSVLGELRDGLLSGLHPSDAETFGDYFADVFRDFEAAHPGLMDKTEPCPKCHRPTVLNGRHKERLLGYWRDVCPTCEEDAR